MDLYRTLVICFVVFRLFTCSSLSLSLSLSLSHSLQHPNHPPSTSDLWYTQSDVQYTYQTARCSIVFYLLYTSQYTPVSMCLRLFNALLCAINVSDHRPGFLRRPLIDKIRHFVVMDRSIRAPDSVLVYVTRTRWTHWLTGWLAGHSGHRDPCMSTGRRTSSGSSAGSAVSRHPKLKTGSTVPARSLARRR